MRSLRRQNTAPRDDSGYFEKDIDMLAFIWLKAGIGARISVIYALIYPKMRLAMANHPLTGFAFSPSLLRPGGMAAQGELIYFPFCYVGCQTGLLCYNKRAPLCGESSIQVGEKSGSRSSEVVLETTFILYRVQ